MSSRERSTPEVSKGLERQLRALGRRVAEGDPDELAQLTRLHATIDEAVREAIDGLRASGHTDADIGTVLGVTRQAVNARWPHRVKLLGAQRYYRPSRAA